MQLQLVDHRPDFSRLKQRLYVMRQEIAEADGFHFSLMIKFLHSGPASPVQFFPVFTVGIRFRPVDQEQIQALRRLIEEFKGDFLA